MFYAIYLGQSFSFIMVYVLYVNDYRCGYFHYSPVRFWFLFCAHCYTETLNVVHSK